MKFPSMLALALALAASSGAAVAAPPSGEAVFQQRCAVCHSVQPAPGKMGPPLAGVAGRKAATLPGYSYSAALKNSKLTWTPETLDAFLQAPGKKVPGTRMLVGAQDPAQRAALVQYLGSLKK